MATLYINRHKDKPYEWKRRLWEEGRAAFPAPPVYTGLWDTDSWIRFVDNEGTWLPEKGDI